MSILLVFITHSLVMPVEAQTTSSLVVSPEYSALYVNGINMIVLDLIMYDVVEMQSFDITITFDPDIVQLDSFAKGSWVSSFTKLYESRDSGFLRVNYTIFGSPPLSGGGVVLHLTFKGRSTGNSPITIAAANYAVPSGPKVYPILSDGSLDVSYLTSSVTGVVFLQGQSARAEIPVSLGTGTTYLQGPFTSLTTAALVQNLDLGAVVSNDSYTFTTGLSGYLNVEGTLAKTVTLTDSNLTLPPLRLLAGDTTADSLIDTADLDAIRDAFDTQGAGIAADLNADGVVNVQDLALAAGNYGLTPVEAYAGWVP